MYRSVLMDTITMQRSTNLQKLNPAYFSTSVNLFSSEAPVNRSAMMVPVGSTRILYGMPSSPNPYCATTELSQYFRSLICVQLKPSDFIASSQSCLPSGLSNDTPRISKFGPLNLLYAATTLG